MKDFFRWPSPPWDAESLFFYSTLLRILYKHDESIWKGVGPCIPSGKQILVFGPNGTLPVSWAAVEGETGTILLFEGTQNWWQKAGQLLLMQQDIFPEYPGRVNVFDADRTHELETTLYHYLDNELTPPFLTVGHSLGGSIAQLVAHRINRRTPGRLSGCITFGSKKVGNPTYAFGTQFNLFQVFNIADPVPRFTPPGIVPILGVIQQTSPPRFKVIDFAIYWHAGMWGYLDLEGQMTLYRGADQVGYGPPVKEPIEGPIFADPTYHHYMTEYTRRLRTRVERLTSAATLRQQLARRCLDSVNTLINRDEGAPWRWDPDTGLPTSSIINPNLPAAECGCHA